MSASHLWPSHTTRGVGAEMGANLSAVDLGPNKTAVEISLSGLTACAILVRVYWSYWSFDHIAVSAGLQHRIGRDAVGEFEKGIEIRFVPGHERLGARKLRRVTRLHELEEVVWENTRTVDGDTCACFAQDDASVKCWGGNDYGALGLGDIINRGDDPNGECAARGEFLLLHCINHRWVWWS